MGSITFVGWKMDAPLRLAAITRLGWCMNFWLKDIPQNFFLSSSADRRFKNALQVIFDALIILSAFNGAFLRIETLNFLQI